MSALAVLKVRDLAERKVQSDQRIQALMLCNTNQPDTEAHIQLQMRVIEARRERQQIEFEITQYINEAGK